MAILTGTLNDKKLAWYAAKGFKSPCLGDAEKAYFASKLGASKPSVSEMKESYFRSQGYAGAGFSDLYFQILAVKVGHKPSLHDMEELFFSDTANNF